MKLKYKIESKDQLPPDHAALYSERDGAWFLNVDGIDPDQVRLLTEEKRRLEEENSRNVTSRIEPLNHPNARHSAPFSPQRGEGLGMRGDTANNAASRQEVHGEEQGMRGDAANDVNAERHLKAGEVEKVIDTRVRSLTADLTKQIAGLSAERDTLNTRLATIQIDQAIVTEATKRGLRSTAIPDITSRARNTFRLVDGLPRAFENDGKTGRVGKDGPMTLHEWIDTQVVEAPHLFEPHNGSGSGGTPAGGSTQTQRLPEKNPFKRETWNVTEQMLLTKSNPELARRLQSHATT